MKPELLQPKPPKIPGKSRIITTMIIIIQIHSLPNPQKRPPLLFSPMIFTPFNVDFCLIDFVLCGTILSGHISYSKIERSVVPEKEQEQDDKE